MDKNFTVTLKVKCNSRVEAGSVWSRLKDFMLTPGMLGYERDQTCYSCDIIEVSDDSNTEEKIDD